jgi:ribosomal 50S subunit-recycling heat shock protein
MRLDLFLKKTRLIPRRTGATELCREGMVSVNSRPARPSRTVRPGDQLRLQFTSRELLVEVLEMPVSGGVSKAVARTCYRVLEEKKKDVSLFS